MRRRNAMTYASAQCDDMFVVEAPSSRSAMSGRSSEQSKRDEWSKLRAVEGWSKLRAVEGWSKLRAVEARWLKPEAATAQLPVARCPLRRCRRYRLPVTGLPVAVTGCPVIRLTGSGDAGAVEMFFEQLGEIR